MNRIKKLPLGKPNLLKKEDTYTVDISSLKYLEQVLSSKRVGLSSGGTHFKAVVT